MIQVKEETWEQVVQALRAWSASRRESGMLSTAVNGKTVAALNAATKLVLGDGAIAGAEQEPPAVSEEDVSGALRSLRRFRDEAMGGGVPEPPLATGPMTEGLPLRDLPGGDFLVRPFDGREVNAEE